MPAYLNAADPFCSVFARMSAILLAKGLRICILDLGPIGGVLNLTRLMGTGVLSLVAAVFSVIAPAAAWPSLARPRGSPVGAENEIPYC